MKLPEKYPADLAEWKPLLMGFWDLPDTASRDSLVEAFSQFAEAQNPASFIAEIRSVFSPDFESGITVVYEALAKNTAKWANFFESEVSRGFAEAEFAEDPFSRLDLLEEVAMTDENFRPLRDSILDILTKYSAHSNRVLRFKAIWLISDWLPQTKSNRTYTAIESLIHALEDKEWQIRVLAFQILHASDVLPKGKHLSLIDRLRKKWSSEFQIKRP